MPYETSTVATETDFDAEESGVWTLADLDGSGTPDLVYIKTRDTESGRVEIHAVTGDSGYTERADVVETAYDSALADTGYWLMRDCTGDGRADLIHIKVRECDSGMVEVHVCDAGGGYQGYVLQTGTCFGMEDNGMWTMTARGEHLVFIKTRETEAGQVGYFASGREDNYQSHSRVEATCFEAEENGTWCLSTRTDEDGHADLFYIKTRETESGMVEVHAATAGSAWQERSVTSTTSFEAGDNGTWLLAELKGQDQPDLVFIQTRETESGKVEVRANEAE